MNIAIIIDEISDEESSIKNLKIFNGAPVISYSIKVAKDCNLFDKIIVITQCVEIEDRATYFGVDKVFKTPIKLINNKIETNELVVYGIKECQNIGWEPNFICCINPSSPFIKAQDVSEIFNEIQKDNLFHFPVAEFQSNIQHALKLLSDGKVMPIHPEFELIRTQDLIKAYYDTKQFYWGSKETWLELKQKHKNGMGYKIPNWRVVDISTTKGWYAAELLYKELIAQGRL